MTYLTFLLVFLVPPIVLVAAWQRRPLAGVGGVRAAWALPLVCLIAFLYTTPWDNYLVYRGVWGYGDERVLGTLWYVPYEEYAFFVLQPILTGLFLYGLLARRPGPAQAPSSRARWVGTLLYAALTVIGVGLLVSGWEAGLYMGLILAWACPILAGLWLYGGAHFWSYRTVFALAATVPTVYLWVADRTAIALGVWDISNRYSFDVDPFGLPVEEATFFAVTNLLVVQGVLLFLHGDRIRPFWRRSTASPSPPL